MVLDCPASVIRDALLPVERLLAADGFRLEAELAVTRVKIDVVAGAEACGDCLVTHSVLRSIIVDKLRAIAPNVDDDDVLLTMPRPGL